MARASVYGLPRFIAICSILLLTSCMVGPNYRRPPVSVPTSYRAAPPAPNAQNVASFGDEKWWNIFEDPVLQQLIRTALKQNYNLQIAASRVLQAQQQVRVTRASEFPTVSVLAQYFSQRFPGLYTFGASEIGGSVSWAIDFWGLYRRATEAARAALLENEWNQRAVTSTLVSAVATSYFSLLALDLQLKISQDTLATRQQSFELTNSLYKGGKVTMLDVREAEQLVEGAAAIIPDLKRQIEQQENAISILLGENPTEIQRGQTLEEQPLSQIVPAGLPSSLLERRPDIRAQEQALVAANANIGVARAQLFPAISLTGNGGIESRSLANLAGGNSGSWNTAAALTQPVFNAGALRANVKIARDLQQQALFSYEQTIQIAFEEVSNALVAYQRYQENVEHLSRLAAAAKEASRLSLTRFRGGAASYFEVLTNEGNSFSAQLSLVAAQLNQRLAVIQLYNALGGGWQQ